MRSFAKTDAKMRGAMCFVLGAAMLTSACGSEPGTYSIPMDQVKSKLAGASKQYTEGGQNTRTVTAVGWSGDAVSVQLSTSVGEKFTQNCTAMVEAVDEGTTRVTPDCGMGVNAGNTAIIELLEVQVDEFIIAVLNDGEMDGKRILRRGAAVTMGNMGDMQREAIEADKQFRENGNSFTSPSDEWVDERPANEPADDWGDG